MRHRPQCRHQRLVRQRPHRQRHLAAEAAEAVAGAGTIIVRPQLRRSGQVDSGRQFYMLVTLQKPVP